MCNVCKCGCSASQFFAQYTGYFRADKRKVEKNQQQPSRRCCNSVMPGRGQASPDLPGLPMVHSHPCCWHRDFGSWLKLSRELGWGIAEQGTILPSLPLSQQPCLQQVCMESRQGGMWQQHFFLQPSPWLDRRAGSEHTPSLPYGDMLGQLRLCTH